MEDNAGQVPNPSSEQSSSTPPPRPPLNWNGLINHVKDHKLDVALWFTRIITIFFTFTYFIPIFGNQYSSYYKVLMSNAATSALRLHLRMPRVQLSQAFLAQLLLEDSCHYLFYSLIFLYVSPVTLVLLPVFLFAVLHSASYSLTLLDTLGQNSWWGARMLISIVEFQSCNILRLVAFTEIFLMPFVIILIFVGRAGLLTPFIYYNFLTLRYSSRRNPYNKNVFRDMRVMVENTANKPGIPEFLRSLLLNAVAFTCRLAPRQAPGEDAN